jgi:hypothetical protein
VFEKKGQATCLTLWMFYGGGEQDRTVDLLNAIQALSQLSYTPTKRNNLLTEDRRECQGFFSAFLQIEPTPTGILLDASCRMQL